MTHETLYRRDTHSIFHQSRISKHFLTRWINKTLTDAGSMRLDEGRLLVWWLNFATVAERNGEYQYFLPTKAIYIIQTTKKWAHIEELQQVRLWWCSKVSGSQHLKITIGKLQWKVRLKLSNSERIWIDIGTKISTTRPSTQTFTVMKREFSYAISA